MVLGYKSGLESVEERLKFFKTNESVYIEDIKLLKVKIQIKNIAIKELRRKLEVALKEKDDIQLTVEKLENASKSLNKLIDSKIVDNCKKGLGYNAVPPLHTSLFMPPKPDLSYIGLEEFTSEPAVETLNAKTSEKVPKVVKKDNGAPIIKDWKSDDKDEREMANHTRIYVAPCHTKKIFGNIKKVGKDFSGKVTPLFPTMMVQAQEEMGEGAKKPWGIPLLILEDELKRTNTAQQTKIDGLKRRFKKLEKKQRSRTHKLKRLHKVGHTARVISSSDDEGLGEEDTSKYGRIINDLDADEDITLVVVDKEPSVDVAQVSAAVTTVTIDDITLVKALEDLKTLKLDIIGIVINDHEEPSKSRTTTISLKKSQDKGKAKMIKEPVKLKKKDQILFDEEVARKLQEEINEQERLVGERARQEEEANIALIET
nr:hypothetical protein [Tanacetum cinerariifolium]